VISSVDRQYARAIEPSATSAARSPAVARRFVAVAVAAASLVLVVYVLMVRTPRGQRYGDLAFAARDLVEPDAAFLAGEVLSVVTSSTLFVATLAIVLVAVARGRIRMALVAGGAISGSVLSSEVLKHLLGRPSLIEIGGVEYNTFPSGHAAIGMSLSLGIVMVAPHRWRWLATTAAATIAVGFGIGVLATGWHRPSDTVGSYLVCATWFSLATALLIRWRGAGRPGSATFGEVEEHISTPVAVVAAVVLVGAALVLLVATFREQGLENTRYAANYVAVCVAVIALAVGIVIGYHQMLRGISLDLPPAADGVDAPAFSRSGPGAG
jgi:membrane-associated phospholipid phosphatase